MAAKIGPILAARSMPGVLVVSDVLLYREGIAAGIARSEGLTLLGTSCVPDAPKRISALAPDAVLLDVSGEEALVAARRLKIVCPDMRYIGVGIGSDAVGLACAEAGLTGFVGRDGTFAELVQTVTRALAGEVECSPGLAALLCARVAALSGRVGLAPSPLSAREKQIATLAADGLSNKEIALRLRIGPATVKNHIHNILEKLDVPRRSAIGSRLGAAVPAL